MRNPRPQLNVLPIQEAAEGEQRKDKALDFSRWLGMAARDSRNPNPRFRSDDDLWR
jgi:hypothetical protein